MKKHIFLILAVFAAFSTFGQELKKSVCIVERNYSEETKSFLTESSKQLSKKGYSKYSEYIDGYLKGAFGSGFITTDSEGENVIVTNNHVVGGAETVNVKFLKKDGTYDEYKNVKIKQVNEVLDFAIIELPENCTGLPLELCSSHISEGTTVYTAGFPGLGNEPTWQLGQGIISNDYAVIKDLTSDKLNYVIQHSAQSDSGNSGGPLLVKVNDEFEVAGINTWKAFFRENTNFSVPVEFLTKYLENPADFEKEDERNVEFFNRIINSENEDDFTKLSIFVSDEIVNEHGVNAFIQALAKSPEKKRNTVLSGFRENPSEGFRQAVAYLVLKKAQKDELIVESVDEIEELVKETVESLNKSKKNDSKKNSKSKKNSRKDKDASKDSKKDSKNNKKEKASDDKKTAKKDKKSDKSDDDENSLPFDVYNPYMFTINGAAGIGPGTESRSGMFGGDILFSTDFLTFGISGQLDILSVPVEDSEYGNYDNIMGTVIAAIAGGQFPMNFEASSLNCNLFANVKAGIDYISSYSSSVKTEEFCFVIGFDAGVELIGLRSNSNAWGISVYYEGEYINGYGYFGRVGAKLGFKFGER